LRETQDQQGAGEKYDAGLRGVTRFIAKRLSTRSFGTICFKTSQCCNTFSTNKRLKTKKKVVTLTNPHASVAMLCIVIA